MRRSDLIDFLQEMILPFVIIALVLFGILAGASYLFHEPAAKTIAIYQAWVSATGNTNVTFENWKMLREANLLPGQSQENYVPIVFPIPITTSR